MKLRFLVLLCVLLAAGWTGACAAERTTVLIYMCGSDLESDVGSATADLNEIIRADLPAAGDVRVLVATGGAESWWTEEISPDRLGIYEVNEEGLTRLEQFPRANMGESDTLRDFLRYGLAQAPAERCLLVLWGHGMGAPGGVCLDARYEHDALMPEELRQALREALPGGKRLDAVVFDACLMSDMETAEALYGYADYMVASQESTVGSGMEYDEWLGALSQDPGLDTESLCRTIVQTYIDSNDHGIFSNYCTMSVLDVDAAPEVRRAVEKLSARLDARLARDPDEVLDCRASILSYGEYDDTGATDLVDALLVAEAFAPLEPQACAQLREAVRSMVLYNETTEPMEGTSGGLSLTLPYATSDWFYPFYERYEPLSDTSAYARLIVHLAEAVEARDGITIFSFDWSLDSDEPAYIWDGLTETGDVGSSAVPDDVSPDSSDIKDSLTTDPADASDPGTAPNDAAPDPSDIWDGLAGESPENTDDSEQQAGHSERSSFDLWSLWDSLTAESADASDPGAAPGDAAPDPSDMWYGLTGEA